MNRIIPIDNQISLINSMLASMNLLIELLRNKQPINEPVHITLKHIFIFNNKVIMLIPDILLSKHDVKQIKEELLSTSESLVSCWEKFSENENIFYDKWIEFSFWWKEFLKIYEKIKSDSTIYLYMN